MFKNVSANWVLTILQVISAYLLMPYTIRALGKEAYGVWILISSITGYLGLLIIGTPMASVRHFAKLIAEKKGRELNEAIATFGGLYLMFGAGSIVVGLVLFAFFPMGFEINARYLFDARIAFCLVLVTIAASFFQQLPYGLMAAYHDFVVRNVVMMGAVFLRIISTIVLLYYYPHIAVVAAVQILVLVFEFVISWSVVLRRYPGVCFSLTLFRRGLLKDIFSFSLYVMLLSIGSQLSFQTDSIVIGSFIKVSDIPYYSIANSLTVYFMEFLVAIAAVVMPMATKLQAEGDIEKLREMFLKWSKISLSLSFLGGVYLLVFGPRFIAWWVGKDFEGPAGDVLRILMLSYLVFLPVRGVAQPMLMGLGKPGLPTVAFLVAGVLNLIMSIILAPWFGLAGVAWGTAIPNILFAVWLLFLACKEVNISIGHFLKYVSAKVVIGSLPVVLLSMFILQEFDVSSTFGLGFAGVIVCLFYGLISVVFVYRNDKYVNLASRIQIKLRERKAC